LTTVANTLGVKQKELEATLQVYAPRREGPVFSVEIPMYNAEFREQYWVALCLKGGQGINHQGLSIGDPDTLTNRKPRVFNECKLASQANTLAVSQPVGLKADVVSNDLVQLEWNEPEDNGGAPIVRYRIFVQQ
jgi:hypothetical protein